MRHFDSTKEVVFLTDASWLFGLGYALGYIELNGSGKNFFLIVHCGSKGLTPTQQRYSSIELECLAIIWAIQKCSFYLCGLPIFQTFTAHRPLEDVFQKDLFDLASPRLQRMCEKIAMYSFHLCWVPGRPISSPMLSPELLYSLPRSYLAWRLIWLFHASPSFHQRHLRCHRR